MDEVGLRLLKKMGYRPGEGLGKDKTGITAPIEATLHAGRTGLGFDSNFEERREPKKRKVTFEKDEAGNSSSSDDDFKVGQTVDVEKIVENEEAIRPSSRFPELFHNLRLLTQLGGSSRAIEDFELVREQLGATKRRIVEFEQRQRALKELQLCMEEGRLVSNEVRAVLGDDRCNEAEVAILMPNLKEIEDPMEILKLIQAVSEPVRLFLTQQTVTPKIRSHLMSSAGLDSRMLPLLPTLDPILLPTLRAKIEAAIGRATDTDTLVSLLPWMTVDADLWPEWRVRLKRLLSPLSLVDMHTHLSGLLPLIEIEREVDRILANCVLPRLEQTVADLVIDGQRQDVKPIRQTLRFTSLLPAPTIHRILVRFLFPKLKLFVKSWLQQTSVDLSEVVNWYRAWRQLLPNEPLLRREFVNLLLLVDSLV